jgi:hypothetical protein
MSYTKADLVRTAYDLVTRDFVYVELYSYDSRLAEQDGPAKFECFSRWGDELGLRRECDLRRFSL